MAIGNRLRATNADGEVPGMDHVVGDAVPEQLATVGRTDVEIEDLVDNTVVSGSLDGLERGAPPRQQRLRAEYLDAERCARRGGVTSEHERQLSFAHNDMGDNLTYVPVRARCGQVPLVICNITYGLAERCQSVDVELDDIDDWIYSHSMVPGGLLVMS